MVKSSLLCFGMCFLQNREKSDVSLFAFLFEGVTERGGDRDCLPSVGSVCSFKSSPLICMGKHQIMDQILEFLLACGRARRIS